MQNSTLKYRWSIMQKKIKEQKEKRNEMSSSFLRAVKKANSNTKQNYQICQSKASTFKKKTHVLNDFKMIKYSILKTPRNVSSSRSQINKFEDDECFSQEEHIADKCIYNFTSQTKKDVDNDAFERNFLEIKDIGENKTERININPSSDISQETIEMDNFIDKLSKLISKYKNAKLAKENRSNSQKSVDRISKEIDRIYQSNKTNKDNQLKLCSILK